ncbi:NAD-dependent histone deacetylase sir2 [Mortierella sp. GBA43]|nr:NAD-dependent histone deacetylase sir2 [Mortierella sp. GBA43]
MHVDESVSESSQTDSEQGDSMERFDPCAQQMLLDLSEDYDEDADEDYEPAADTTVDEGCNRIDTSSSEDDDSFSDIDINNIEPPSYDNDIEETPYHDTDPLCLDRLTEEEKARIIDEAREFGISHIVEEYVLKRVHTVKKLLLMTASGEVEIAPHLTENDLIRILTHRLDEVLRRRHRLPHIHTLEHVVQLLESSKNILVLTGAGVSVSCGIPDFRSSDGIYSRLSEFELDDPTQMFELDFFRRKPQVFYSFAREIFPSNFTPSPSHNFIKLLEDKGKLLRNYTQNIDTLEQKAGIRHVLQCHGSFATASCVRCKHKVPGDDIKEAILNQEIALCNFCRGLGSGMLPEQKSRSTGHSNGESEVAEEEEEEDDDEGPSVMKPDIVFFGERLPPEFDEKFEEDRGVVDLLIVIGSSLKVSPVSDIMHQLPNNIPQILINRTPITHMDFDVQLLGNCDTIVAELCRMLGWELKHKKLPGGTSNIPDMDKNANKDGSGKGGRAHWTVIEPNTYTFEGAILGDIEYESSQSQSSSRKRGRFGPEGYDGDTDEEGRSARRRGSFMSERRNSLAFVYSSSDSDSDHSDGTIRGSQPHIVSYSLELESSADPIRCLSSPVFAATTPEVRSGDIQDLFMPNGSRPHGTLSQEHYDLSKAQIDLESHDDKVLNPQGTLQEDFLDMGELDETSNLELVNVSPGTDPLPMQERAQDEDRRMSTYFKPLLGDQRQSDSEAGPDTEKSTPHSAGSFPLSQPNM